MPPQFFVALTVICRPNGRCPTDLLHLIGATGFAARSILAQSGARHIKYWNTTTRLILPTRQRHWETAIMQLEFLAQNVKCNGCASAIRAGLGKHPQVREVQVDVPTGRVTVHADSDIRTDLGATLKELGYPEKA